MQRRVALLAALPAVLLGAASAPAQQNPFVGSWRGVAQVNGATITFNTVMAPDLPVYHATGTTGGYYTQEPVPRPPGGVFRYKFTSPNSVTLQDTNLGGAVTFNRVR
jgi:hypothetical protein